MEWFEGELRSRTAEELRLQCFANPDLPASLDATGETALMSACRLARPDLVAVLLEHGADPNFADKGGATALVEAIGQGDLERRKEVLALLTSAGAELNRDGLECPVHRAVSMGSVELVRFLFERGALLDLSDDAGSSVFHLAIGPTKLDAPMIRILAELGGDLSARNHIGKTIADYVGQDRLDTILSDPGDN